MNSSVNYIPNGDNDRVLWLNNFNAKLPNYAATLNIIDVEIQSVANDAAMFSYIINTLNAYKQTVQNIVAFKTLLKHNGTGASVLGAMPNLPAIATAPIAVNAGVFDRVSKLVARIKNSTNYNTSIGQDLNIIATVPVVDTKTLQPILKVILDAGRPHIKWGKGFADAMDLQVDRNDGNGFITLGRFITPNYIDTFSLNGTMLLAQWDYKGMFVIGNTIAGIPSLIESVVVKKQ